MATRTHRRSPAPQRRLRSLPRELTQTVRTQAVARIRRHRQAERFIRTPATTRRVAAKFRAAAGTGEAAGARAFCPICHQLSRTPLVELIPGSSGNALLSAHKIIIHGQPEGSRMARDSQAALVALN